MRTQPFHRSRLFWLGLAGLVLMAGLWVVSLYRTTSLMINGGAPLIYWDNTSGAFSFVVIYQPSFPIGPWAIEFDASAPPDGEPAVLEFGYATPASGSHDYVLEIKLPYWFLMIGWILAWLALMAWWVRRKRKMAWALGA